MNTTQTIPLGPWPKGFQNVNDPVMTPKGCLAEAVNVYLDSGGIAFPRLGYALVTTDVNSLFNFRGRTFGVSSGYISEIFDTGVQRLYGPGVGPVTWSVMNDEPVFVNKDILGRVTASGVKEFGVPACSMAGGAATGDFMVAACYVNADGEEGAMTPAAFCAAGASVSVPALQNHSVRYYQSRANGDVLYEAGAGLSYTVVEDALYGRPAESQYKARMPGGSYARYHRGRLFVARGRTLYYSDPLRYGLRDARGGFVRFEAQIDWIESVETGLYVAVSGVGVYFLHGDSPEKWERKLADVVPAQPGAVLVVPTAQMKLDIQFPPDWVAVWFTSKGFALGFPTGVVHYPQNDLLSGLPLGTGTLHFEGDRLLVLSQ